MSVLMCTNLCFPNLDQMKQQHKISEQIEDINNNDPKLCNEQKVDMQSAPKTCSPAAPQGYFVHVLLFSSLIPVNNNLSTF
ncbi:hypothetical protein L596_004517 [Steinernema carpocapsae]|uniref:Uncharacterized protein n=1 Tax=Steinernema carpocapsae TaxID=34508 RepID=A0A4U8UW75_STECR|nr:hypothetical protein L596_004517 [Steinernema carpocapsae]